MAREGWQTGVGIEERFVVSLLWICLVTKQPLLSDMIQNDSCFII